MSWIVQLQTDAKGSYGGDIGERAFNLHHSGPCLAVHSIKTERPDPNKKSEIHAWSSHDLVTTLVMHEGQDLCPKGDCVKV